MTNVKSMTKDQAAKAYVDMIMDKGNPSYFVWNHVSGMAAWELEEALEELDGEYRYVVEADE